MEFRFDGVTVLMDKLVWVTDRVELKMSSRTMLVYLDGKNIGSLYPEYLSIDEQVTEIGWLLDIYEAEVNVKYLYDACERLAAVYWERR